MSHSWQVKSHQTQNHLTPKAMFFLPPTRKQVVPFSFSFQVLIIQEGHILNVKRKLRSKFDVVSLRQSPHAHSQQFAQASAL